MRKILDKLLEIILYCFSGLIFFPPTAKPLLVILFGIVSFIIFIFSKKRIVNKTVFTISILVFFMYVFSLTASNDILFGLKMLETKLSMFFLPLIFSVFLSSKKISRVISLKKFSEFFYYINSLYSIILLGYFTQYENPKYPGLYISGFYQSACKDIPLIGEQHTYIGLMLATSVLLYFALKGQRPLQNNLLSLLALAPMLAVIWLLQTRAVIIGLIFGILMLFWRIIRRNIIKSTIALFITAMTAILLTPEKNNRFLEIKSAFNYSQFNSASQRLIILECTIEELKKAPLMGLGIGTTNKIIGNCFNNKINDFGQKRINTHNQYLDLWLTCGFSALILFNLFLFSVVLSMINSGNKRLISILFLLSFTMFFENILERQTGIIVFYFIVFFLVRSCTKQKQQKVLLIGPLPNPITGLSIANERALATLTHPNQLYKYINTSPIKFQEKLGRFNIGSLLHFSRNYFQLYKIFSATKVYYTPGQTFLGVIKYAPFILFSKLLGKELIVHIHGNYLGEQFKKLKGIKKIIFHRLLSLNNKGIVLSNKLMHNLSPFMPSERIFVLSNFYDDALTKEPIEKLFSTLKICYLSSLMNEKGIHHLLWALEKLNVLKIPFEANIAGLIDQAQQKSLLERMSQIKGVNYIGVVRGADKRKLLQESNVFVLPTFYKMEGLPISIIEAMATGNIIISTAHGAIPDLVTENVNGFLVQKKSVDAIVEKLLFIANNPTKAIEISDNNTQKAKNNFNSKKFSEELLNIIHA